MYFLGLQNSCGWWLTAWNLKMLSPWKKSYDQPRQHIKQQRYYFADKSPYSQRYGFSNSHVCMWELDHKEGWALQDWCFWTMMLAKTLESPLDSKEIKPVNPKGNQPWIFNGRTNSEAEASILWPSDGKIRLIGKDCDTGKHWRQEEKGMRDDKMIGWHHWLNGHEFEQTLGDSEGQGSLACSSPWGHKELDTPERMNKVYMWTNGYCGDHFLKYANVRKLT